MISNSTPPSRAVMRMDSRIPWRVRIHTIAKVTNASSHQAMLRSNWVCSVSEIR
jgi:hypothetical protein